MRRLSICLAALLAASCSNGDDAPAAPHTDASSYSADAAPASPENTAEACRDGIDNDHNGLTDCDDPGCAEFVFCQWHDGGQPPVGTDAAQSGADAASTASADGSLAGADASNLAGLDAAAIAGVDASSPDASSVPADAATAGPDAATVDAGCQPCGARNCGSDGCGGSCGTCGTGQACDPSGHCVTSACNPLCGADQWCDSALSADCAANDCCAEICSPPNGCPSTEVCVHDASDAGAATTGTCQPPTCNGTQCQQGEICFDLSVYGGPAGAQCTCMPGYYDNSGTHTDTCLGFGYVCSMDLNHIAPSLCRLPEEFEDCQPSPGPGCATPAFGQLDCFPLNFTTGKQYVCLRACATANMPDTSLCAVPYSHCVAGFGNHCWYNYCADPTCDPSSDPSCKGEAGERALYFQPCDAAGSKDGTCIEWAYGDGSDTGVCAQGGTAVSQCDPDGVRQGSNATLCPVGSYCFAVELDAAHPGKRIGLCQPLCNAVSGAAAQPPLSCASASAVCDDLTGAPATETKTRMGVCVAGCDLFGSGTCAKDALGNDCGCGPTDQYDGQGYCQAQQPNAAGLSGTCSWSGTDPRNPCGDRLVCVGPSSGGWCEGFCDTAACPDDQTACTSCKPSGYYCEPFRSGAGVGYCY